MIIGITGGIGSGKSYVCRILRQQGFPVYFCDDHARDLMMEDVELKSSIIQLVGEDAYFADGTINKKTIADFLYENAENQAKLNALIHPKVKNDFKHWAAIQIADYVFVESAILFESGFNEMVDKTILVYSREEIRVARVVRRDRITRLEALRRMKMQMPEAEKMKLADYVIINNGNDNINKQLENIQI